ncbi:MAG TPA: hypothetical protein VJ553_01170 [Candidatus Paceibacterota bacterium]|nr:hypothetical protein [Candidatus Paceibacterota bacterium]
MRPISVAIVMVLMLGVGVYIGISGLATQIAVDFDLSRGSAADVVCAPDRTVAAVGQAVLFTVIGLDPALPYAWSADSGRVRFQDGGKLSVTYDTIGKKTVSVFVPGVGGQWQRIPCSVTIQ